ncbi:hypothetical protein BH11MYX2_BH11MYX2_30930 [soil metagenome]
MSKKILFAIAALCCAASVANAQIVQPVSATPERHITPGPKKLETAYLLSGIGVGASSALFISSFFVGKRVGDVNMPVLFAGLGTGMITPQLGQIYAGHYITWGLGIRLAAAGLVTYAVVEQSEDTRCSSQAFAVCRSLKSDSYPLLGLAAIAYIGGAAWEFTTMPDAVDDYNKRATGLLGISPTPMGRGGYGLAAVGTF